MRNFTFSKELQTKNYTLKMTGENNSEVYVRESERGGIVGMGFQGKRNNPDWHYYFKSMDKLLEYANQWRKGIQRNIQRKEERAREKAVIRQIGHGLEVGAILYSSWGYDQTNIDFYQVVELRGKCAVMIQKIGSRRVDSQGDSDRVIANPDFKVGEPFLKRPQGNGRGVYITLNSYADASLWDGHALYETSPYAGH